MQLISWIGGGIDKRSHFSCSNEAGQEIGDTH